MAGHRGGALGHGGPVQELSGLGTGHPRGGGFIGVALFARMFAAVLPGFSLGALLVQSVVPYVLGLAGVWVFTLALVACAIALNSLVVLVLTSLLNS